MTLRRHLPLILGLLALLGMMHFVVARAADLNVTWTAPTQNTDGSAIPATGAGSLASTRVEWGSCNGAAFGTRVGEQTVNAPAASTVITGVAPGTWCVRAFARNTYGAESEASNVASRVVNPPTPQPPTITVTVPVAFEINLTPSGLMKLGRDVGSVPVGTECSEDAIVANNRATYYAVPAEAVSLYRKPKSSLLVAECGA